MLPAACAENTACISGAAAATATPGKPNIGSVPQLAVAVPAALSMLAGLQMTMFCPCVTSPASTSDVR